MKPKMSKRSKNPDTPEYTARYYINNAKMLPEVIKSKEQGKITDELAEMFLMLTRKYSQRSCFSGYSFKEDMVSDAVVNLVQNALKFNLEKSSNPFAYYTTCINSSFLQFLNTEKKHRRIRDKLLIEIGENPSFNFLDEAKGEFQEEINDLKFEIVEATDRIKLEAQREEAKREEALQNMVIEFIDEPEDTLEPELVPNVSLLDFGDE